MNDNLGKVNIRSDLSEVRITLSQTIDDRQLVTVTESGETITYNYLGPQYMIALAAFVVRWDSVLGADYYRVTRESRNLYTGESEITEFGAQGETVYEDIMTASPDVVNIYRVQACDDVEGCGPQSDPLELVAPSPDSPPLFAHIPLVTLVSVNFSDPARVCRGDPYRGRCVRESLCFVARAEADPNPPPASQRTPGVKLPIYTDLLEFEDDEVFAFIDDDVDVGVEYFYRVRACNALGCVDSDHVLISVGPPGPPPVSAAPETTQNVVGQVAQLSVRWDASRQRGQLHSDARGIRKRSLCRDIQRQGAGFHRQRRATRLRISLSIASVQLFRLHGFRDYNRNLSSVAGNYGQRCGVGCAFGVL